jgi:pimeloyl-ACP methyl ester carboxylesterase
MRSPGALRARRHLGWTAVAGATLLLLSSCSQPVADPVEESKDSSLKLERFYDQKLSFGSCADYTSNTDEKKLFIDPAECARLEVPLDYDKPDGKVAKIAVLRVPASGDPKQRIGSLVVNPGGPGGPGMVQAVIASKLLAKAPVISRFDVVGFDPRGVGVTEPAIQCYSNAERDRGEDQVTLLSSSGEWTESDTKALVERCAEGSGGKEVLSAVGTRNTARDMDVLRAVLGDDKLTYAGQSYGTRLGAVYAEMFPDKVRAMVLDGAADPRQDGATRRLSQQTAFQRSFDLMAASCAKQTDCPLGSDPSRANAAFQRLVRPLIDNPVPAGNGRTLNFNQATGGVTAGLYMATQWPQIIDGIQQLAKERRGDKLLAIYDTFAGRTPDGKWRNYVDANFAINCNDEEPRTAEQETQLRRDIFRITPFVDTGRDVTGVTRDACEAWPTKPTLGIPYAQNVKGLPQTLIISITGDPSTPYEAGKTLAESLGGTMLTVEGEQHTIAMSGASPCVTDIFSKYLTELDVPDPEQRCTL